mgnify:CR=1 FL=1
MSLRIESRRFVVVVVIIAFGCVHTLYHYIQHHSHNHHTVTFFLSYHSLSLSHTLSMIFTRKTGGKYVPPHMRNRSGGGDSSSRSRDSGGYDDRRGGRRDDRRGGSSFWSNDRRGGDRRDDEGRRDTRSYGGSNSRWKDFDKPVSSRRRGGRGGGASNGWSGSDRTDKRLEKQLFESEHVTAGINFDKYDDIPIETSGDNVPDPIEKFSEEQLTKALYENTVRASFKRPTPVQKYSIPIGALGRDLMACAQTGSGKTGGFLFPVIAQMLKTGPKRVEDLEDSGSKNASQSYYRRRRVYPNALIIAPTRELAIQIYDQARKFCYATGVAPAVVYVESLSSFAFSHSCHSQILVYHTRKYLSRARTTGTVEQRSVNSSEPLSVRDVIFLSQHPVVLWI